MRSGMELITARQKMNESFDETLPKVLIERKNMKNNYPDQDSTFY